LSDAERLRRSWIANAAAWTASVREQKIESRRVATDAAIVEAVLAHHPHHVLDLGCGEGWLTRALAAHGVEATGIDASPQLIEAARAAGGGSFHALPYERLGALGETFDVVVANFALLDEHVPLDAIRALLRPHGSLVIQTVHPLFCDGPYRDGWRLETFAAFEGDWPEPMPWYFRTLASWFRLLRESGFAIEDVREPLHPERLQPLSLILTAGHAAGVD
jgi:2-polyprenyl-3-methyl-5-hydroxy-6-metoxy-1,4-benzoquinol methylase